jgi:hypothetical protein
MSIIATFEVFYDILTSGQEAAVLVEKFLCKSLLLRKSQPSPGTNGRHWKVLRFANGLSDVQKEIFTRKCQKWDYEEMLHQFSSPHPETGEPKKINGRRPPIRCLERTD